MRIVAARLVSYAVPFRRPYVTARGSAALRRGVIAEIKTDTGIQGLGESALLPDAGGDFEAFELEVDSAAGAALGSSIGPAAGVTGWQADGPASAAIETAIWDALGRSKGFGSLRS